MLVSSLAYSEQKNIDDTVLQHLKNTECLRFDLQEVDVEAVIHVLMSLGAENHPNAPKERYKFKISKNIDIKPEYSFPMQKNKSLFFLLNFSCEKMNITWRISQGVLIFEDKKTSPNKKTKVSPKSLK